MIPLTQPEIKIIGLTRTFPLENNTVQQAREEPLINSYRYMCSRIDYKYIHTLICLRTWKYSIDIESTNFLL